MKRMTLIMGAALAVVASAALAFATAHAETKPVVTNHETAIKACSTVNPTQPVEIVNAVEDGSGIGFSLVWLNEKATIFGCATPTATATSIPTRW